MPSDVTSVSSAESAQDALAPDASTCSALPEVSSLESGGAPADPRRRRKQRPETRAARRERLYRAAGEAIERAAETGCDAVALMVAATGAEAKYCEPVIRQHPWFHKICVPGERRRKRQERRRKALERRRKAQDARDAAALASVAVADPVVWVRREFGKRRRAAYRMTDLSRLHWSNLSGGLLRRANRLYLHAYVWCDGMIVGTLPHSCRHGPPPHRIKVCITKVDNKKYWREIERAAPMRPIVPARGRQAARTERRAARRQRLDQDAVSP